MARLLRAVDTLPDDKKRIVHQRYGFPDTKPVTIRNLALEWGVVYETANRWVNVVLAELREECHDAKDH
jgi:DNA-directed RNA polymerase sigma subunit (sigma70/sigma32)